MNRVPDGPIQRAFSSCAGNTHIKKRLWSIKQTSLWVIHTNYKPQHTHPYSVSLFLCFLSLSLSLSLPFINEQLEILPGGNVGRQRICICIFPISLLDRGSWAYQRRGRKKAGLQQTGIYSRHPSPHLVPYIILFGLLSMAWGKGIVVEEMIGFLYLVAYWEEYHAVQARGHTHVDTGVLVSWSSPETKVCCSQCVAVWD